MCGLRPAACPRGGPADSVRAGFVSRDTAAVSWGENGKISECWFKWLMGNADVVFCPPWCPQGQGRALWCLRHGSCLVPGKCQMWKESWAFWVPRASPAQPQLPSALSRKQKSLKLQWNTLLLLCSSKNSWLLPASLRETSSESPRVPLCQPSHSRVSKSQHFSFFFFFFLDGLTQIQIQQAVGLQWPGKSSLIFWNRLISFRRGEAKRAGFSGHCQVRRLSQH